MSSHLHMIVARHGEQSLEAIIRDIKKYTSVKLIQAICDNEQESRRELFVPLRVTGLRDSEDYNLPVVGKTRMN